MKTRSVKKEAVVRAWHLVDCSGLTLGRVATQVARLLIGKHKSDYTPSTDMGDYVVVVGAAQIKVTGNKLLSKSYFRHSGYPGGFREVTLERQLALDPRRVIEHAVSGMLPKNKLQSVRIRRLKVYAGSEHSHTNRLKQEPQS